MIKEECCEASINISSYDKRLIFLEGAAEHDYMIKINSFDTLPYNEANYQTESSDAPQKMQSCIVIYGRRESGKKQYLKMLIIQEKDKNSTQLLANISFLT